MRRKMTPQQRAAMAAWLLATGHKLMAKDIAKRAGLTIRGAQVMMKSLGDVLPIRRNYQQEWVKRSSKRD